MITDLQFERTMDFRFVAHVHFEQMVLRIRTNATDITRKLFEAVKDGRIDHGPYDYLDGEIDENGVSWVNAETWFNGRWYGLGANDDEGDLYISTGLHYDPLDGTAPPVTDPEAYWLDFLQPLRKLLAILN